MDREQWLFIISVILALCLFAPSALILPRWEDKSGFAYQVVFFLFTLGAVVLLWFACTLVRDGITGICQGLKHLKDILSRRSPGRR